MARFIVPPNTIYCKLRLDTFTYIRHHDKCFTNILFLLMQTCGLYYYFPHFINNEMEVLLFYVVHGNMASKLLTLILFSWLDIGAYIFIICLFFSTRRLLLTFITHPKIKKIKGWFMHIRMHLPIIHRLKDWNKAFF